MEKLILRQNKNNKRTAYGATASLNNAQPTLKASLKPATNILGRNTSGGNTSTGGHENQGGSAQGNETGGCEL
ncbi:MAG: hypothetical protein SOW01_00350 [Mediterranea sp.]|nr:hypothetical protein [Mediterranea sp.]